MKRFSVVSNGYDIEEVNRFIDIVIKRLDKLNTENISLNEQIRALNDKHDDKIKVSNVDVARLEKAILAVQETSDKIKERAQDEARVILEEAKNNANSLIHEALIRAEKTEHERLLLEKNIKIYKERVRSLMESQLSLIDDLDSTEI